MKEERAKIVAFLKKHTNLHALAELLENGIHTLPETSIREYCTKHGVTVR